MQIIWIILVILTLFAFLIGYLEFVNETLVVVLLVSTIIKGELIIEYFMGLKDVSLSYRLIPTVWLLTVVSLIALAYFLPIKG